METILVGLIIGIAALYASKTFYQKYKQGKHLKEDNRCLSCGTKTRCNQCEDLIRDNHLTKRKSP